MEQLAIAIPNSIENLSLPNPELLQFYKDVENRSIWIEGEIDESLFEASKLIMNWNREDKGTPPEDRKPIKIFINSPGGTLEDTLSFVGLVEISKTPIITVNMGMGIFGSMFNCIIWT